MIFGRNIEIYGVCIILVEYWWRRPHPLGLTRPHWHKICMYGGTVCEWKRIDSKVLEERSNAPIAQLWHAPFLPQWYIPERWSKMSMNFNWNQELYLQRKTKNAWKKDSRRHQGIASAKYRESELLELFYPPSLPLSLSLSFLSLSLSLSPETSMNHWLWPSSNYWLYRNFSTKIAPKLFILLMEISV